VLVGARNTEQVTDNAKALDFFLSHEEMEAIKEFADQRMVAA
jgi:aryl-alcohol dehydrogenase-like predicted oxidoreductase